MGSTETATASTGALEKLTFFTGTGRHRAQISYFFWMQIGSWWPREVGLVAGSRLYRIRRRCSSLMLSESPESKPRPITAKVVRTAERIRPKMIEAAAYAV